MTTTFLKCGKVKKDKYANACVALLKACAKNKDLQKGSQIHNDILKNGLLEKSPYVGSALISMYAKCGALCKAQDVFDELSVRHTCSWNALISGYTQHGLGNEALKCYDKMQNDQISANDVTYISVLKACGSTKAMEKAKSIHDDIIRKGLLASNITLGTALVDMYAKCGNMKGAKQVLFELPVRDVVSWNALITGFIQHAQFEEALDCFEQMKSEDLDPDSVTYICLLKACCSMNSIQKGKQVHDEIIRKKLLYKDVKIGNSLVAMYAKCGELGKAQEVFEELQDHSIVSWNSLITGYVQEGLSRQALDFFERFHIRGISADVVTFICMLKACANVQDVTRGKQIHYESLARELLGKDILIDTTLVDMYAKCGKLTEAERVVNEIHVRDAFIWHALLAGYVEAGHYNEGLKCFKRMKADGVSPDVVSLILLLKCCGNLKDAHNGKEIHGEIISKNLLKKDIVLGNALVDMYVKCGALTQAMHVLNELPFRDVVSWNSIISGYVQQGQSNEAMNCYVQMRSEGLSPNVVTFICILKACGTMCDLEKGNYIHDIILRKGLLMQNVMLGTALVDMYVKCGAIEKAEEVLNSLPVRNTVSWSTVIAGYAQQGLGRKALNCFRMMNDEDLYPDSVTFIHILKACGSIRDLNKGKEIHDEILTNGMLDKDVFLGNALVDMYVKCCELEKARQVLIGLPARTTGSWNALIAGYAQQGQGKEALNCFECVERDGVSPDAITFISVLNACSHAGLVDEGEIYFMLMMEKYCILPELDHHTCIVDLFGRAGLFEKAVAIIGKMPACDHAPVWAAFLGACRKSANLQLARSAFEQAAQLDDPNVAPYLLMTSMYATADIEEDAK